MTKTRIVPLVVTFMMALAVVPLVVGAEYANAESGGEPASPLVAAPAATALTANSLSADGLSPQAGNTVPSISLGGGELKTNFNTNDAAIVLFGDGAALGLGHTLLKWRVIAYDGEGVVNEPGTMTLFLRDIATRRPEADMLEDEWIYTQFGNSNEYATSALRSEITNYANSVLIDRDKAVVAPRTLVSGSFDPSGSGLDFGLQTDCIRGPEVTDLMWPLSTREAAVLDNSQQNPGPGLRLDYEQYWLRSPGGGSTEAAHVDRYGEVRPYSSITAQSVWAWLAVRPALNLKLEDVLFVSPYHGSREKHSNGLGPNALAEVGTETRPIANSTVNFPLDNTMGWRLTLIDRDRDFRVTSCEATDSGVKVGYEGATACALNEYGTYANWEYVSAIITDKNAADPSACIKYYGRIKLVEAGDDGTGEVEINLEDKLSDGDMLYLFSEGSNGGTDTEYASALQEVDLPVTHKVKIADGIEHGTVTADGGRVEMGSPVTLTVTPDEGYELESLAVTGKTGGTVEVTDNQFSMPNDDVIVSATFKAIEYDVSATATPDEGGTVSVDKSKAIIGETVTVTVQVGESSVFENITVKDENGASIDLTENSGGAYSFTMPASNVSVSATFTTIQGYAVQVAGEWLSDQYVSGEGWSYEGDETGGTLTLDNAKLQGTGANGAVIFSDVPLTIVLVGENSLDPSNDSSSVDAGVSSTQPLMIKGDGSLAARGVDVGIRAQNGLTICDGAVIDVGDESSARGILVEIGSLSIGDSTVTATGETGIMADFSLVTISGSTVMVTGTDQRGMCASVLKINDSTVTASGKVMGFEAGSAAIDNSVVEASGEMFGVITNSVSGDDKISVTDSIVRATGTRYSGFFLAGDIAINSGVVEAVGGGEAVFSITGGISPNDVNVVEPAGGQLDDRGRLVGEDGDVPTRALITNGSYKAMTLEFGEGHEEFVQKYFSSGYMMDSESADVRIVSGAAAEGATKVSVCVNTDVAGDAMGAVHGLFSEAVTDWMDGDLRFSGNLGTKAAYADGEEYAADMDRFYNGTVADGTTLYVLWEKPVTLKLSVKQPVCGTTVATEGRVGTDPLAHSNPYFEVETPEGAVCLPHREGGNWVVDKNGSSLFTGTIVGGQAYYGRFQLQSTFGYYIPESAILNASMAGGSIVSRDYRSDPRGSYTPVFIAKVTADHDWDEGVVDREPTCTEPGVRTVSCKHNGEDWHGEDASTTVEIEALGHDWGEWSVAKEPTATAAGEETRTCKHDPTHVEKRAIPATGARGLLIAKMTKKGKKGLKLSWTKVEGAEGYDVFFSRGKTPKLVKTLNGDKTLSWTKAGLKKGTAYRAYVKAWTTRDGKKTYVKQSPLVSAHAGGFGKKYTDAKKVKVAKTKVSLKKGKSSKIKAKVVKIKRARKLLPKSKVASLRYLSTDVQVAKVSKTGKITAKAKGTCKVYVYAANGVRKVVTVTVK